MRRHPPQTALQPRLRPFPHLACLLRLLLRLLLLVFPPPAQAVRYPLMRPLLRQKVPPLHLPVALLAQWLHPLCSGRRSSPLALLLLFSLSCSRPASFINELELFGRVDRVTIHCMRNSYNTSRHRPSIFSPLLQAVGCFQRFYIGGSGSADSFSSLCQPLLWLLNRSINL